MSEVQGEQVVRYLSKRVKGFRATITIGRPPNSRNVQKQAVNGILTLTKTESDALDLMMQKRPDLKANLQKIDNTVDPVAVERQRLILLARERKGPSAVKGAMHSGNASQEKLRQTDQEARQYTPPADDKLAGEYVEQPVAGIPPISGDPGLQHPGNAAIEPQQPTAAKVSTNSILSRLGKQ